MFRKLLSAVVFAAFLANSALGDIFIFFDEEEFELFNLAQGKFLKGIEDFEESNLAGVPDVAFLDDPLQGNVPNMDLNGLGFPTGLITKNLIIQSNVVGLSAPVPAPGSGLQVHGPDSVFGGVPNSVAVGALLDLDSTDLIFTEPNHTGVGFDVIDIIWGGIPDAFVRITVFDKNNQLIAQQDVPGQFDKVFFGIWSDQTIGRINVGGFSKLGFGMEHVDNIQMWIPAPGTLALLGLAGLMGTRRRRR